MDATRQTPVDALLTAVAVVFALLYTGYFLTYRTVTDVAQWQAFFEMTLFGAAVVALFGSVWLAVQTETRRPLQRRLLVWGGGGTVFLVVVNVSMMSVVSPAPDFEDQLLQLLLSGGFGMAAGLVMGVLEIQAIQQERAKARADVYARKREEERQRLELLNQYLRHEILNKLQIIQTNTDLLLRRVDDSFAEQSRLETIAERAGDLTRFVQSIRSILQASDHQPTLEPVDLVAVLEEETGKLVASFGTLTVTTDLPEQATVEADNLLRTVVSNLLENAAENGAETIHVELTVAEETAELRVADDGPGIPSAVQETLFDPPESGDHGYGLFLTKNLVELYGGRLELVETGPNGTTFLVRLSRATPDATTWGAESVKAT